MASDSERVWGVEGMAGLQGLLLYSFLSRQKRNTDAHTHVCTNRCTKSEIQQLKTQLFRKLIWFSLGFNSLLMSPAIVCVPRTVPSKCLDRHTKVQLCVTTSSPLSLTVFFPVAVPNIKENLPHFFLWTQVVWVFSVFMWSHTESTT